MEKKKKKKKISPELENEYYKLLKEILIERKK